MNLTLMTFSAIEATSIRTPFCMPSCLCAWLCVTITLHPTANHKVSQALPANLAFKCLFASSLKTGIVSWALIAYILPAKCWSKNSLLYFCTSLFLYANMVASASNLVGNYLTSFVSNNIVPLSAVRLRSLLKTRVHNLSLRARMLVCNRRCTARVVHQLLLYIGQVHVLSFFL